RNIRRGAAESRFREQLGERRTQDQGVDERVHPVECPAGPGGPEAAALRGSESCPCVGVVLHFVYNILPMRTYQFENPLAARRGSIELIADTLREAIIQGRLTAGEPLRQEQLASHFSVSRIPLREALRSLESEGWIEFLPNRGARVAGLS